MKDVKPLQQAYVYAGGSCVQAGRVTSLVSYNVVKLSDQKKSLLPKTFWLLHC